MEGTHLLASPRPSGSLPDSVRKPGHARRRDAAIVFPAAPGRALGPDDARGAGKILPRASWAVGAGGGAGFEAECLIRSGATLTRGKVPRVRVAGIVIFERHRPTNPTNAP